MRTKTPLLPPQEREFEVRGDYITLGQLLHATGMIGTGGEAKFYLGENVVLVNGVEEDRRGRKLRPGDVVNCPLSVPIRLGAMAEPK